MNVNSAKSELKDAKNEIVQLLLKFPKINPTTLQIVQFLLDRPEAFEEIKFGEVKFEIRDHTVYRAFASNSILIKGNSNNEAK